MTTSIVLNNPIDAHVHFRDGNMLSLVAPLTAHCFSAAVIMPNVMHKASGRPVLVDTENLLAYETLIRAAVKPLQFEPLMTLYLTTALTPRSLSTVKDQIVAAKLYPQGITTNSDHGVSLTDPRLLDTLGCLSAAGIPLCVHAETNGFVLYREHEFIEILQDWREKVPGLKIIVEHVTTAEMIDFITSAANVYGTITAHHLLITLDDVIGGLLDPHLFCKPIAKREEDRDALRAVLATEYSRSFMLGTDSAPHPRSKKECCGCAAGCFTAPIALPLLAGLFLDELDWSSEELQAFVSDHAVEIYGLQEVVKKSPRRVTLERRDFLVPNIYKYRDKETAVVPMWANHMLGWTITEVTNGQEDEAT